jgi:citrate lyase subunit gamma (acyl carrier protein)
MKFSAGSYESSDCLITISKQDKTEIKIESIVFEQFGDQIKNVLLQTLKKNKLSNLLVECYDKGALDYTIEARLQTAIKRMEEYYG